MTISVVVSANVSVIVAIEDRKKGIHLKIGSYSSLGKYK